MGLIESIQKRQASAARVEVAGQARQQLLSSYYTSPQAIQVQWPYYMLVGAYKGWVYSCIDKIAKAIAMIPLKLYVYRREGRKVTDISWRPSYRALQTLGERKMFLKEMGLVKEEVTNHPFLDLMRKPNSMMTRMTLWYESVVRLELGGLCGWLKQKNGLGTPQEIWPLPLTQYANLKPKVSQTLRLEYWDYQDGDVKQRFDPEDVCLFKYPHPASPFQGMSPLMAQSYPYDIDNFMLQTQRALYKNQATPGLLLSTDQQLADEQIRQLREQISEQYEGSMRAGETMVLHSGLKADKLSMTARDALFDAVNQIVRDRMITSYDLSASKMGIHERDNRATAEVADLTFIRECIAPKTMLMEEVLEATFLPDYDDGLTADFELPDLEDKEMRIKEKESNLRTGYSSINEERVKDGLDEVEWGEKPWLPMTMVQVGEVKEKPPEPGPPVDLSAPGKAVRTKSMGKSYWTEERKDIHWKLFTKRIDSYTPMIQRPMKAYFKSLKSEVLRKLDKNGGKVLGHYSGWSRAKVQAALGEDKILKDININKVAERTRVRKVLERPVKVIMSEVGQARMKDLLETVKIEVQFNVNDPKVLKWLGQRMETFSKAVTNNTFDQIEEILREGFTSGLPVSEIADQLRDKFESWDQYRAPLIARTETIAAMNQADLEGVRQSGLEDQLLKCWLSARDDHVRETHQLADQEYQDGIPIDEMFRVGGDEMDAPGEGTDPGENINCRCTLIYLQTGEGEGGEE